jgi:hypothetical protein
LEVIWRNDDGWPVTTEEVAAHRRIDFSPFFNYLLTLILSTTFRDSDYRFLRGSTGATRSVTPLGPLEIRPCRPRTLEPKGSDSCPPSQQGPNHITTWQTYHLFSSAYYAFPYGLGPSYRLLTAPSSLPCSLPSDPPSMHQIKSLGSVPLIYYQYASSLPSTVD